MPETGVRPLVVDQLPQGLAEPRFGAAAAAAASPSRLARRLGPMPRMRACAGGRVLRRLAFRRRRDALGQRARRAASPASKRVTTHVVRLAQLGRASRVSVEQPSTTCCSAAGRGRHGRGVVVVQAHAQARVDQQQHARVVHHLALGPPLRLQDRGPAGRAEPPTRSSGQQPAERRAQLDAVAAIHVARRSATIAATRGQRQESNRRSTGCGPTRTCVRVAPAANRGEGGVHRRSALLGRRMVAGRPGQELLADQAASTSRYREPSLRLEPASSLRRRTGSRPAWSILVADAFQPRGQLLAVDRRQVAFVRVDVEGEAADLGWPSVAASAGPRRSRCVGVGKRRRQRRSGVGVASTGQPSPSRRRRAAEADLRLVAGRIELQLQRRADQARRVRVAHGPGTTAVSSIATTKLGLRAPVVPDRRRRWSGTPRRGPCRTCARRPAGRRCAAGRSRGRSSRAAAASPWRPAKYRSTSTAVQEAVPLAGEDRENRMVGHLQVGRLLQPIDQQLGGAGQAAAGTSPCRRDRAAR